MRKIIYSAIVFMAFTACKKNEEIKVEEKTETYAKFGDSISADGAITKENLLEKYKTM